MFRMCEKHDMLKRHALILLKGIYVRQINLVAER